MRDIDTLEAANRFLEDEYISEFNRRFTVESELEGTAFVPSQRTDLDRIFSIHSERLVNRDNTVKFQNLILQIEKQSWRATLAGCRVIVYRHLDNTINIGYGAHTVGKYSADGKPLEPVSTKEKTPLKKSYSKIQTGHLMCYEKRSF